MGFATSNVNTGEPAIDRVVRLLGERGGVTARGKGWRCCCPAHDDADPSLDVDIGKNGAVLFRCRSAGCSAASIAAALGLTVADLFGGPVPDVTRITFADRVLKTYDYRDESDEVLFQTLRLWAPAPKGKDFRQRRPDGKGGWANDLKGVRRILYRLPALLNSGDALVFFVEGEKDADALARLGLIATTSPMGAGNWKAEYAEFLRNRRVVVIPDNDEAGCKHASKVLDCLKAVASQAVRLDLPDLPHKGDVSDWLAAGGTKAKLLELVERAIESPAPEAPEAPEPKAAEKKFLFIDSATFDSGDYRPDWLVKGIMVRNQPATLAGPSKGLKTNLSLDLAISLASGTPFLGQYPVPVPVRVAVVSGESGAHTLQETARRICAARGIEFRTLGPMIHWCFSLPTFSDQPGMIEYTKEVLALGAAVNIIDPLYMSLGEVDARNLFEMGGALRAIGQMILNAGATPVLVHHANGKLMTGEVMELAHLSYTGLEQYVRQWLLINRHSRYQGDGVHELKINIGGSAGQSKLLLARIEEGLINDQFRGRKWAVAVQSLVEFQRQATDDRDAKKAARERETERKHDALALDAIDAVVEKTGQAAATMYDIKRQCSNVNATKLIAAIKRLEEDGLVMERPFAKKTAKGTERHTKGYARVRTTEQPSIPLDPSEDATGTMGTMGTNTDAVPVVPIRGQ